MMATSEARETGLPWIPLLPKRWRLKRLKYLVSERSEKGYADEPLLTASQSHGVIEKKDYGSRTVEAQKDLHLLKLVEPGDYVISLRSFQGGIEFAHKRGIISPAYTILEPGPEVRRGFYEHYFKSAPFVGSMTLFVTGIREGQNIDYVRLSRAYMPVPPEEEQEQIGRFVRHLDSKVNRLIKAKRRLIELLNEQKQAIIHQAVTRGLDPTVPLKSSGEDGVRIPSHWERRAVMQLFSIGRGEVTSHEYIGAHPGDYPLYSSQTSNDGIMGWIDSYMFDGEYLTWTTDGAHAGTVFYRQGKFSCTNVCGTLSAKVGNLYLPYMRYALGIETKSHVRVDINPKLMNNMMARIRVNVPPLEEQEVIFNYLKSELEAGEALVRKASAEVELIREYRTRLVADVVTGQLDVRQHPWANTEIEDSTEAITDGAELDDDLEETEDVLEEAGV